MYNVIIKSIAFIIIIFLGAFSVRKGILTKEEGKILNKIIMNFTLPCALIAGFGNVSFSFWMAVAILFGLCVNFISLFAGKHFISKNCTPHETANNMLCTATYNIGNFSVPFCQSFLPEASLAYLISFDIGNSIMTLGGAAAVAQNCIQPGNGIDIRAFVKRLSSSVPFICYVILLFLSVFHIRIPQAGLTVFSMIGQANMFLVMFTIGTQLDVHIEKNDISAIVKIIALRIIIAAAISVAIQFVPMEPALRKVLVIAIFSPLSGIAVIFSQQLGCDTKLAAMMSSITIPVSLIIYMFLLVIMA